jgi:glutathione S-transferase
VKIYNENNPAPNPRKVRIFLAEKGVSVPLERVLMQRREHKAPEFMKKNSLGQVPVLELDDGTCISESLAICRYFEELHPTPPLFGRDPVERAQTEMWLRRSEFRLWNPMGQVWITDPRTAAVNPNQFPD